MQPSTLVERLAASVCSMAVIASDMSVQADKSGAHAALLYSCAALYNRASFARGAGAHA
jgi:hypothetical protein